MAFRKIPYSKMSLRKLEEIEAEIIENNPDLKSSLNLYYEEERRIAKLKEEKKGILDKIVEIKIMALRRRQQEYENAGYLSKFFIDRTNPSYTESEKAERERLYKLLNKFRLHFDWNKYQSAYETHERLLRIQKHISQKRKREIKKKMDRAIIAAYKNKTRRLAGQIKSELRKQMKIDPRCPYCGKGMCHDPHCDHIYPISKGGLSTPQNMVYICADCNFKKTDFTLSQFINKYGLSRLEIEQRLEKLGKDY